MASGAALPALREAIMTARGATRNAVLEYIRADTEPRPRMQVIKFMFKTYSTTPAATREQLRRLCREEAIEIVDEHWYRVAGA